MTTLTTCTLCGGLGQIGFEDPVTRGHASMLCPSCTPEGVDLDSQVEAHTDCVDPQCVDPVHMPDREDPPWTAADEAAWLWDDDRQRRRADR